MFMENPVILKEDEVNNDKLKIECGISRQKVPILEELPTKKNYCEKLKSNMAAYLYRFNFIESFIDDLAPIVKNLIQQNNLLKEKQINISESEYYNLFAPFYLQARLARLEIVNFVERYKDISENYRRLNRSLNPEIMESLLNVPALDSDKLEYYNKYGETLNEAIDATINYFGKFNINLGLSISTLLKAAHIQGGLSEPGFGYLSPQEFNQICEEATKQIIEEVISKIVINMS